MAITPRTILNNPAALAAGLMACCGVGLVVAAEMTCADRSAPCASPRVSLGSTSGAEEHAERAVERAAWRVEVSSSRAAAARSVYDDPRAPSVVRCEAAEPVERWDESRWMEFLDCLDDRGAHPSVVLEQASRGLSMLGRSLEVAVRKGELLDSRGRVDEGVVFLESALARHDVPGDARIEHLLARALVWRGADADIQRAFQMLASRGPATQMRIAQSCAGKQTMAWLNHALIERSAGAGQAGAGEWDYRADRAILDAYVAQGCAQSVHTGRWEDLAQVVGAGMLAEQLGPASAEPSRMVEDALAPFHVYQYATLCADAVPDRPGLRSRCEARVRGALGARD